MDGMPIIAYAQLAQAKTSIELFRDMRDLVSDDDPLLPQASYVAELLENPDPENVDFDAAFMSAYDTLSRIAVLVCMLEGRGVLGDIEQNLTELYEPTRRPGYAGVSKPLERAARDAAEGPQT